MIDEMIDHFEEKNENKYLILDDVGENKEVSKKYEEVLTESKKKLKRLMVTKKLNMEKIFKTLSLNLMMIDRDGSEDGDEDDKFYRQFF